jgi:hypothetical protein
MRFTVRSYRPSRSLGCDEQYHPGEAVSHWESLPCTHLQSKMIKYKQF